jgi:NAD(P)-dependent dehydrogenase (short-subunit alcohol dehydrogenase family)
VSHAVAAYGALHYAVNNAGIGGAQALAGDVDLADWERVININLNGVLYGMRYQIPAMLKAGARGCAIVNMASMARLPPSATEPTPRRSMASSG